MSKRIGVHSGSEIRVIEAPALGVDEFELDRPMQAQAGLKARTAGGSHALGNQPLAPFGAAACQHLAAIFGRHAGAKTMGASAADFARLISAFHDSRA